MKIFQYIIFFILAALVYVLYQYMYMKPAFMVGEKAPSFRTQTIDGKNFSLDDMSGKLVLLDFWGTWCGPCRKQLPELSKLYRTYRDSLHGTFEVVSVAMDDDTAALRSVINSDSLVWPVHLRESKSGGPIIALYQIKKVPTSYLLNDQGQIISVNPDMNELKSWLEKIDQVHHSKTKSGATN